MKNHSEYNNLRALLSKYRQGTCTPDELKALFERLKGDEADSALEDDLREEFDKAFSDFKREQPQPVKIVRMPLYKKISIAAAIIVAIFTGFYLIQNSSHQSSANNLVKATGDSIQPGGNQAVLTLDNGKKIILDSNAMGKIAVLSGTVVSVTKAGTLTYEVGSASENTEVSLNTLSTPTGGFFKIILPDGSNVWLNSESQLTFPSRFDAHQREVTLKGEGYFEVVKDNKRPFSVKLPNNGEITVLGTEFNVMTYANEPDQQITLVRGSIRLKRLDKQVILKPGEQAVVSGNRIDLNKEVSVEHVTAWKNGLFDFQNDDLSHILRQIARWYNTEIVYSGLEGEGHYTGSIRKSSNINEVLKMLEIAGNVHFTIVGKKIIVNEIK